MTEAVQSTSALGNLLEERLMEWERARKPQELKLLECYQDVMRIPRADDTSGTGAARAKKAAGLFIGSTRNKVRASRAKINDALFGNGELPFDTNPTNETLAKFADVVEDIVTEQLERMKFRQMIKTGVNTLATYGTGFVYGPFVRKETLTETVADNSSGYTQIKEEKYEYDFPYFELGSTLDAYPDPEARNICDGLGIFWVTMESPHTVASWRADKSYRNIAQALQGASNNGSETGSEIAGQMRGNVEFWNKNGRIKVARFFGKVPRSSMRAIDPNASDIDTGEMVNVIVIMAGGVVVKVSESPYGDKTPALSCCYEEVDHEIWGVGVADNNAAHQKTVNAAFRLFMEGKGMALLGTKSVDRSKFLPTEDFKKYPGKVFQMKAGLSAEERANAIIDHKEEDITGGWLDVIRMSEQFSDDDTGITKYTQGDDSRNLNKTAAGISMIMSASSLPIKEVIQNIDANWIEPIVESIINWNLKYLEVETVQKIHGDEAAQAWAEIKRFGKTSFMDWQATGTSSFMQKEILINKLRAFADWAMGNPATAALIDARELLEQTWHCMEIGKESPILKEEDGDKVPPQVKQKMEQAEQHVQMLEASLKEIGEKYNDLSDSKEVDNQKLLLDRYRAETDRLKLIYPTMPAQIAQVLAQEFGIELVIEQHQATAAQMEVPQVPGAPAVQEDDQGAGGMPPGEPLVQAEPETQPGALEAAPLPDDNAPGEYQGAPPTIMPDPNEPPTGGFFTPEGAQ
ncbi:portal protein [Janthinobacterium sp. RA13]|uniref:portal protein n=1 Tax=Janthinobacterium sp. RA13 TaxID=1502762 RepID=UPI000564C9C6|nr:hypothetical protein [Janthinobacterium sp. RA13]